MPSPKPKAIPQTPAKYTDEAYLQLYNQAVNQQPARTIHLFAIPVVVFSLFALLWAIPFPHLKFLGQYNGFINWASFLLAFMVYFYLRLRPAVSYIILLFLLVCAYGVTELLAWQVLGGPQLWVVAVVLLVISAAACVFTIKPAAPAKTERLLLAAPLWEVLLLIKTVSRKG